MSYHFKQKTKKINFVTKNYLHTLLLGTYIGIL